MVRAATATLPEPTEACADSTDGQRSLTKAVRRCERNKYANEPETNLKQFRVVSAFYLCSVSRYSTRASFLG